MPDDLKTHALSEQDYYALLEVAPASSEAEIRRAYRKTALKYHPDKQGSNPPAEVVDKFHQLQVAFNVLSDPDAKAVYDNVRRAREEREAKKRQFGERRRQMIDDLERRERGVKRSHEEDQEEERVRRLAADGARRVREMNERRRAEAEKAEDTAQNGHMPAQPVADGGEANGATVPELERSVRVRWRREGEGEVVDKAQLEGFFKRFGALDCVVVLKDKRKKLEDDGHERKALIATAVVVYVSIASTHAAIEEAPKAWPEVFGDNLESARWANGEEPAYIAALADPTTPGSTGPLSQDEIRRIKLRLAGRRLAAKRQEVADEKDSKPAVRKVPSFASFKGPSTPLRPPPKVSFSAASTPAGLTPGQRQKEREDERKRLAAEILAREAEGLD